MGGARELCLASLHFAAGALDRIGKRGEVGAVAKCLLVHTGVCKMLATLVLSVTYQCPIRCRYCGVNAGPHRTERTSLAFIRQMVNEARALGEHLTEDDLLWAGAGDCWKVPCDSVLKNIVIAPDGELVVCCGIGSDEVPETVVGNVHETPLIELISQEKMKKKSRQDRSGSRRIFARTWSGWASYSVLSKRTRAPLTLS